MTSRTGSKADIERQFGFSQSGTFRCAYGNEKPLLIITVCVTAVIAVAALLGIASLIEGQSAVFFFAILLVMVEAVILMAGGFLVNLILGGKECFYHADEQKLSIEIAGKWEDFFYSNIIAVRYDELVLLKKQRGFRITVTTRKTSYVFNYLFGRNRVVMTPEKTVFALLEERAGLGAYASNATGAAKDERSVSDVVSELPELPSVMQRAAAALEEAADMPEIATACARVSPALEDKQSAFLGRIAGGSEKISYSATEADEIVAKGSFRMPHKYEYAMFFLCTVFGLGFMAEAIIGFKNFSEPQILFGIVFLLLDIALYRVIHHTELNYVADGKEFRVTDKDGSLTTIYFCDVQEVRYKPLRFLWINRGFKVSIVMKYTTVNYNYLHLRNKLRRKPEDTPFAIIERMIKKSEVQNG